MKYLILCPTYNHADALFMSVASARAQQIEDWELVIVGDGAPPRMDQIAAEFTAQDARIRYVPHPKGPRYGETYRDAIIRDSDADVVCHLSDDDLWAPDQLDIMGALLREAEWVNQSEIRLLPDGSLQSGVLNHGKPEFRAAAQNRKHVSSGLNYVGYRRDTYLKLPEGWTDAPWEEGQSDQYMWAKFMRLPELSIASTMRCGALKLTSHTDKRFGATPEFRAVELGPWLARIGRPGFMDSLRKKKKASVYDRIARVFAVSGGAECATLAEAFDRAGLRPVDQDATPNIAVNGALMDVPLTAAQLDQATLAWLTLRSLVGAPGDAAQEQALVDMLGTQRPRWIKALHLLNQDFPDAAMDGVALFEARLDGTARPAQLLRAVLAARAGDAATAQAILDDTPQAWHSGQDFQNAQSVVKSFQTPSARRPWLTQARPPA
ncbi:glycosyltransferase family 2 protein [Tateyamaria sp.]|uniref:glycosyltransferase family 2 protein n=1 Tax=Tateyamaria sp. TaxID=1929288 RepID=UPI003B20CD82